MSEAKLFEIFVNSLEFDVSDYLVEELTDLQKEIIDNATSILEKNIIGEMKSYGGSIKQNEEKFNELIKQAEKELENVKYKDIKKVLKEYLKKLKELILKTCVAIIPLKELPWVEVVFRTIPRIVYDNNNITFLDNAIAYYGEIKCFLDRTTIFGKIKDQKSLFAPFTGNLDLGGFKLEDSQKEPKYKIFPYVNAIINSLNSAVVKTQLAKYHENYQRHGDPICDYFMEDDELLKSMDIIISGLESERIKSDMAVCSIAFPIPLDKTTLIIVTDEGKDENKYERCFEALLRFSAVGCRAPSIKREEEVRQPGGIRTPGGQELKAWTAEELAQEAQKRMTAPPNIPAWTEEELTKFATERGSGIPEGMEVWTKEELHELAEKRRGDGLNIPEWKPEKDMAECSNCGYSLRPGWNKCPICDTPVGSKPSLESNEEVEDQAKDSTDESKNQEQKDLEEEDLEEEDLEEED